MASSSKDLERLENQASVSSDVRKMIVLRTRMLKLHPDNSFACSKWAVDLLKQRQCQKAKRKFKRSIQISPDTVKRYDDWVTGLYLEREFEEVILVLEKYYQKFKLHYNVQNTVGFCFLHLGDYDNAIKRFQKAVSIKFDCRLAHFNWVLALYLQGKKEEALEKNKKASQFLEFPMRVYLNEIDMLKEDLKREENQIIEDLIKAKLEGFEFLIAIHRRKARGNSNERSIGA